MSERMPNLPSDESEAKKHIKDKKVRKTNWNRTGAIAGVLSLGVAAAAWIAPNTVLQSWFDDTPPNRKVFEGPIAQIAIQQEGWDMRGFTPGQLNSMNDQIGFTYAGHFKNDDGSDRNATNQYCNLVLHANPATNYPYGGDSGYVYIITASDTHPDTQILHNPTLDAVYRATIAHGNYLPPQCWPGDGQQNNDVRYPHDFPEYFPR